MKIIGWAGIVFLALGSLLFGGYIVVSIVEWICSSPCLWGGIILWIVGAAIVMIADFLDS